MDLDGIGNIVGVGVTGALGVATIKAVDKMTTKAIKNKSPMPKRRRKKTYYCKKCKKMHDTMTMLGRQHYNYKR